MAYIKDRQGIWPVSWLCLAMGVSETGFYKYLKRPAKQDRHAHLLAQIYEVLKEDEENANYGVKRIFLALVINKSYQGSYSTVLRVCRENGLIIKHKRRPKSLTRPDARAKRSENLIKQNFTAFAPNTKWLSDITEVPCMDGKLYLAAVLDCFCGKIVGFCMDDNMRAELCKKAFKSACSKEQASGMLLHSDAGSQYTSKLFRDAIADLDALQSMSGIGNCYDNARMESWFATLKKEKLYKINTRKMTKLEVKTVIFHYIYYYNLRRIYSTNGGYPPEVYRQMYYEELTLAA